ncbi:MAG TPA: GntR family transcriptional regulator [Thermoanaerobaculia bacterium]|nr:GntR family transcriptional regulator [Thermoanaerobaculia bacterium]
MLKLSVSRREPLPIRVQLGEQLRHQIEEGVLAPGDKLPTVRELAAEVRVNYNTVRAIYGELERGGYVTTEQGRGTFVVPRPPRATLGTATQSLRDLVDDALARAVAAGVAPADFARTLYTRAKLYRPRRKRPRIAAIECNDADLRVIAEEIRESTGIAPETFTIDAVARKPRALAQTDVIATTFSHLDEVQKLARDRRVIGLMLEPSYPDVVAEIAALPRDAKVGLVCFTDNGAAAMLRALRGTGLHERTFLPGALEHPRKLAAVLREADRVYGSGAYFDEGGDDANVRPYVVHLSNASLRFLRRELDTVR